MPGAKPKRHTSRQLPAVIDSLPQVDGQPSATPPEPIPDFTRLDRAEISQLKHLRKGGMTQVQIAEQLGCAQSTVSKWLTAIDDPLEEGRNILREGAPELAWTVRTTKNAAVALNALENLEVSTKRAPDQGKGGGVQVFIGVQKGDVQVNIS